jgi:type IV secretion system protein VirD4
MTQRANPPTWLIWTGWLTATPLLLAAWQWLASFVMLILVFKGKPSFRVMPWSLVQYVARYHDEKKVVVAAGLGVAVATSVLVGICFWMLKAKGKSQYGTSRFAKLSEIRKAGLIGSEGILVGKLQDGKKRPTFLTVSGNHHVCLAAPTGSGKGVGPVIANLLSLDDSIVCTDIKKTNWMMTAQFRKSCGHKVYLFDPGAEDRRTHRWNPLSYIGTETSARVNDIQKIASILFPDVHGTDPIWTGGCRTLFQGVVLYLLETPGKVVTLGQVARETYAGDPKRFTTAIADRLAAGNPYSEVCVLTLSDYVSAPDKTRDSIRKTFTSRLELFLLPNVDAATSGDDFDLRRLRKEKISIFLGIPAGDIGRFASLQNLFFQQVLQLNTTELPSQNAAIKVPLVLLMDEFKALGKMQQVVDSIAFLREYMIRLMPVFQGPSQIIELYGEQGAKSFFEQFTARIVFEPPNRDVAEAISRELGQETVKSTNISKPTAFGKGTGSSSTSEAGRNVMLPEELQTMGEQTSILFRRGGMPIKCDKIFFYKEPIFVQRLKAISPYLRSIKAPFPSEEDYQEAMRRNELAPLVPQTPAPITPKPAVVVDDRPTRPVEAKDLAKLDSIPLSDFANLDFSGVEIPGPPSMTDEEMHDFTDKLYQTMFPT